MDIPWWVNLVLAGGSIGISVANARQGRRLRARLTRVRELAEQLDELQAEAFQQGLKTGARVATAGLNEFVKDHREMFPPGFKVEDVTITKQESKRFDA